MNKNVVIRSLGTAGFQIVGALKQATPLSEERISQLVFQAPSVLMEDLPPDTAQEVSDLLNSLGAYTEVMAQEEAIESGDDQHEVSLIIHNFANMSLILEQLMKWLHCSFDDARSIINNSPQPFLGKISRSTAQDLAKQFQDLGATILISNLPEAQFDLFLRSPDALQRRQILQTLQNKKLIPAGKQGPDNSPLLLSGLSAEEGKTIWQQLGAYNAHTVVVNRDFSLYDIELTAIGDLDALRPTLTQLGIPDKVIFKLAKHLPILIKQDMPSQDIPDLLSSILATGSEARADLTYFQTFDVHISSLKHIEDTAHILATITQCDKNNMINRLRGKTELTLEGPFSRTQARWIGFELSRLQQKTQLTIRD